MNSENPYRSPDVTSSAIGPPAGAAELAWSMPRYTRSIIARRCAASCLDSICLMPFVLVANAVFGDDLHDMVALLSLCCALTCYHTVLEGLTGRTIGKFVFNIKVVDYQGNGPGLPKALVRTLLRFFEVYPFAGLPAGIAALVSKRGQRLGDMLARTLVVYADDTPDFRPR
jgi:uncharacterized RDD family membrane protein YckC